MKVLIVATRRCSHRPNLERTLQNLNIGYEVIFVEDRPEVAERFGIRHSPNVVVDEKVVFRGQPSEGELRAFFEQAAD